MQHNILYIHL